MKWPEDELNQIATREDLARYLQVLAGRLETGEEQPFENRETVPFVDAAGRWTGAMHGLFANIMNEPVPEQPTWSMIAAIFHAALIYE